mmetsp:Transcript_2591/g.10507  ORF Transcript_2591/g.10507 Transcript_2591/m.10507 type:complete len:227 (-) Transcript_2591:243-923(-)
MIEYDRTRSSSVVAPFESLASDRRPLRAAPYSPLDARLDYRHLHLQFREGLPDEFVEAARVGRPVLPYANPLQRTPRAPDHPSELAALVRERVVTGRVEHGLVHEHPELREDRHHPRRQLRAPSGHHDPPNVWLASQPRKVAHGGTGLPRQRRLERFRPAPPAPVRPRVAGLALVLRPAGVRDRRVDQRAVEIPDVQLPRLLSAHRRADRCRSEPRVDSRVREDLR